MSVGQVEMVWCRCCGKKLFRWPVSAVGAYLDASQQTGEMRCSKKKLWDKLFVTPSISSRVAQFIYYGSSDRGLGCLSDKIWKPMVGLPMLSGRRFSVAFCW